MALMVLASFTWALVGLLALAFTIDRHYYDVHGRSAARPSAAYLRKWRSLGWLGLTLSLVAAVSYKGWAVGATAWLGIVGAVAFAVMLLLAYRPTQAARVLAVSVLLAAIASLGSVLVG